MKEKWWKTSVVYQIYPRSFYDSDGDGIGDLPGIICKLDYLKYLGVDVIWLSPVYESPQADNGYDISDYRKILKEFGSMEDFDRLLQEAHALKLKIVMDLVVNHTSDEHVWFAESRKGRDNPYHDYYIWRKGIGQEPPNNWGSWFYGSAWKREEQTGEYYLHIFSEKQPDLNWENKALRSDIYAMMKWWLDRGIDGFRMDVISLISKSDSFADGVVTGQYGKYGDLTPYCENGPRVHAYLQEMNREVLSRYDIMTVGEAPNATVEEAAKYTNENGTELNMIFQFEHVVIDHGPCGKYSDRRFRLQDLVSVMSRWQEGLYGKGWNSLYLENHDQPRSVSRFGNDTDPKAWDKSAKMLATALHMLQGTPYIYQGQEIGMTNPGFLKLGDYRDIEAMQAYEIYVKKQQVMSEEKFLECLRRKGRDNARTPMQWDASPNAGFTEGKPWIGVNPNYIEINVEAQKENAASILSYYRELIRLRKRYEVITDGRYRLLEVTEHIWAYERRNDREVMVVLLNFSGQEIPYASPKHDKVLISNYADRDNKLLRPYEAVVYYQKCPRKCHLE